MVRQQHPKGCGIAVIAMLAGITYVEALALYRSFAGEYDPNVNGVRASNIAPALWRRGLFTRMVATGPSWPPAPFAPAHACQVTNPGGGHIVVMDGDGHVLDPLDGSEGKRLSDWKAVHFVLGVTP